MARQAGILKLEGALEGMTFYQLNGQYVLRKTYGHSKERIRTEPNFQRTRENNQEFSGAASAGKALRTGLALLTKTMSDPYCTGRLLKICKQIIALAEGTRGQRPFLPAAHKALFCNFSFHQGHSFDTIFSAPYTIDDHDMRQHITLRIPDFNTSKLLKAPGGATHFRVINLVTVLSSYQYNSTKRQYEATDWENNSKNSFSASSYFPLGGNTGEEIQLTTTLSTTAPLAGDSAVVVCLAVEFYQEVTGVMNLLKMGSAMKIAEVY